MGCDKAVAVYSWEQAVELALSDEWEIACLEASNGLSMCLDRDFRNRYQNWNLHIAAIDKILIPIIDPVAIRTIREHQDVSLINKRFKLIRDEDDPPPAEHESFLFRQVLLSTVSLACMEAEYSDLLPLAFFSEMSAWYLAGHFPCGLTDEYPNGKLMVF